jgi:Zn-dependent peptidase ImmA (M78 family)
MSGIFLAKLTIEKYRTSNILELVERVGITLVYEKWHPITHGEFNKKTKQITINLNSPLPKERIIAHELGHYFADVLDNQLDTNMHEQIAEEFASYFTNIRLNPKVH